MAASEVNTTGTSPSDIHENDLPFTYEVEQCVNSERNQKKNIKQKMLIPKKFDAEENFIPHLQEHGYVVLKNVANEETLEQSLNLFWNELASLGSGIERDDVSTWVDENWPGYFDRGFFNSHNLPQTEASWMLRSLPKIKQAFAKIWNTEDLLTSMDIMIGYRPWFVNENIECPFVEPLHRDQATNKKGFHCVQGMLILKDVMPEIGGLQIVPGTNSPEYQDRFAKDYRSGSDWVPLRESDPLRVNNMGQLVLAKAGDFILWDSRTIHGGYVGPGLPADAEVDGLVRLCQTICMMPSNLSSSGNIRDRKLMFKKGRPTTHWPIHTEPHSTYNRNGRNITGRPYVPVELDETRKKLLGVVSHGEPNLSLSSINPALH